MKSVEKLQKIYYIKLILNIIMQVHLTILINSNVFSIINCKSILNKK